MLSKMVKKTRDWTQIYAIYGLDEYRTLVYIIIHALLFSFLSLIFLLYFKSITFFLSSTIQLSSARFVTGLIGSLTGLLAFSLLVIAANFFYSAIPLRWEISQRMISTISDWSTVKTALDVGCGRGILLNAVALQLKKQGSSGRVVGLDQTRPTTMKALRTAGVEGVQEYVTCREGDVRRLPFRDNYFDVVVSGAAIRRVGDKEERERVLCEVVRVLKHGGVGVVWDLQHVPEYVKKLKEMKMVDIRVSERVTAYMVSSQIVSFRKPDEVQVREQEEMIGTVFAYDGEVRIDWRCHNLC